VCLDYAAESVLASVRDGVLSTAELEEQDSHLVQMVGLLSVDVSEACWYRSPGD
jgi:hypothetical protein